MKNTISGDRCSAIASIILTCLLALFLLSCESSVSDPVSDSGGSSSESTAKGPEFTIVTSVKGMTDFGSPKVTITVKNVGSEVGYNVSCNVNAKKNDTIIDSGFAYFANGNDIAPGEKAQDDATFFDLTTLDGYALIYDLSWLERKQEE